MVHVVECGDYFTLGLNGEWKKRGFLRSLSELDGVIGFGGVCMGGWDDQCGDSLIF